MSYGWLTESALIPKPAIPIQIDDSSINAMKIALLKDKQITKMGIQKSKYNKKIEKTNKGIEERAKKDYVGAVADSEQQKLTKLNEILSKKAQLYERQREAGVSVKNSLIDFQYKQIADMRDDEQREFEQQKEQFLRQKKEEVRSLQQNLLTNRPQLDEPQLGFSQNVQDMERAQWEEQMISELEGDMKHVNDSLKNVIEQSYDKRLTQGEKEKLKTVIVEEQEVKDRLTEISRKRKEAQELRNEKLRKLIKK